MSQSLDSFDALQSLRIPDDWQTTAIRALKEGRDAVVQAPTGSGKTYVFEQYYEQGRPSGRVIYTVPTRALANDKYAEWKRLGWRVGITTGDVVIDANAPLIVATLEAQQEPQGAALYVIDEYQWIGDEMRGNHYEGVVMTLPVSTQLLLLSGSVANPDAVVEWLRRLGRDPELVVCRERPVPLNEIEVESTARQVPSSVTGYWTRRLAAALIEDLGPILVFAPHRKAAEKIARDAASRIDCAKPLRLTPEQERAAGPHLAKLLSRRVAFHHSGLSYIQRAGLIEPLAKAGQLRIVVATLGLSAGINFSLRSVLVTTTRYMAGGEPREVSPAELLQMFGRAGRRGLDEQGFVIITADSPRLGQARTQRLKRNAPLPWRPLLRAVSSGQDTATAASDFARRLFTDEPVPLGIEHTLVDGKTPDFPCGLWTDTGRARLVRRENNPERSGEKESSAQQGESFCTPCPHRRDCLALDPKPTLLWLWNRLGLLDRKLATTRRGRLMRQFSGPEGLGVVAAIEDTTYPIDDLVDDLANLAAADRFCGNEPRWAGRLAIACGRAFRRFSSEGFLVDGIPINYGSGGEEVVRALREKRSIPREILGEHVTRGDIDRLLIEWRSLLRQIAGGESIDVLEEARRDESASAELSESAQQAKGKKRKRRRREGISDTVFYQRWAEVQQRCRELIALAGNNKTLPGLPAIPEDQRKAINHRLYLA